MNRRFQSPRVVEICPPGAIRTDWPAAGKPSQRARVAESLLRLPGSGGRKPRA